MSEVDVGERGADRDVATDAAGREWRPARADVHDLADYADLRAGGAAVDAAEVLERVVLEAHDPGVGEAPRRRRRLAQQQQQQQQQLARRCAGLLLGCWASVGAMTTAE